MTTIAVVDHGAGNLLSISAGLERSGSRVIVVTGEDRLAQADGIVLPGVGSAAAAMRRLDEAGLVAPLRAWDRPLLGICVGFQILFAASEEGATPGLGLLPGTVRRLEGRPLPHMGWNDVDHDGTDPLFTGVDRGELFYFANSYAPPPNEWTTATASHGGETFAAAARSGIVVGVQFHPERSSTAGRTVLGNFVAACREDARAA